MFSMKAVGIAVIGREGIGCAWIFIGQFVHHASDDAGVFYATVRTVGNIGIVRYAEDEGSNSVVVFAEIFNSKTSMRT